MAKYKIKRDKKPALNPKQSKKGAKKEPKKKTPDIEPDWKKKDTADKDEKKSTVDKIKDEYKSATNKYLEDLEGKTFSIKDTAKRYFSSLVRPRSGYISRRQFAGYFFTTIFLLCAAMAFAVGSTQVQFVVGVLGVLGVLSLICQRFNAIGLKWFVPYITAIFLLCGVFIAGAIVVATSGTSDINSVYGVIVDAVSANTDVDLTGEMNLSVGFIVSGVIVWLAFGLLILIMCFLKDGLFKRTGLFSLIYVGLSLVIAAILPGFYYTAIAISMHTAEVASGTMYKSIFSQQEDGSYLINGNFFSGETDSTSDDIIAYYDSQAASTELKATYRERADFMTDYSDNIKIISIFAQNVYKDGNKIGLIELGIYRMPGTEDTDVTISTITIGTSIYEFNKTITLSDDITFIPIECPVLQDMTDVNINTVCNGETKILRSFLVDYDATYEEEATAGATE